MKKQGRRSRLKFSCFFASIFSLFCIFFNEKRKTLSKSSHAVAASSAAAAPSFASPALRNGFEAITSAPAVGATAITAVPRQTTKPRGRVSSVTVKRSSALRWNSTASSSTRLRSWS